MHPSRRASVRPLVSVRCALAALALAVVLPAQSKEPPAKGTREAWLHAIALELAKTADIDRDGKIVAPEWEAFADTLVVDEGGKVDRAKVPVRIGGLMLPLINAILDSDGDGKLTAGDLGKIVHTLDENGDGTIGREELGALPWPGERAPDFELSRLGADGESVKLSSFATHKPVALIFSDYACPGCREPVRQMAALHEKYRDEVEFLVVYVHEMPPLPKGTAKGAAKGDPAAALEERKRAVAKSVEELNSPIPAVVDEPDGRVDRAYGGAPVRLYLIGLDGTVAYAGGEGPHLFAPDELEAAIRSELAKPRR